MKGKMGQDGPRWAKMAKMAKILVLSLVLWPLKMGQDGAKMSPESGREKWQDKGNILSLPLLGQMASSWPRSGAIVDPTCHYLGPS